MDNDVVIRAEGVGKRYVLGSGSNERYTALRDVVADSVRRLWRRGARAVPPGARPEPFWALKDVSFEIGRGDVVGIIGRNGAGKSTLLKILSRITEPTSGRVTLRGRVASLLEVGTGFHPELTGRENILLNGVILGMTRAEIAAKFDQIVAFSEVEKFLDTPVKRYSSGMYVRLAFAVAAHLEPEILVVDEVLAVGDANFQKKCLGKMDDIAKGGRTVLFVSHNMAAIKSLTRRSLVLNQGSVQFQGDTAEAIGHYNNQLATGAGGTSEIQGAGRHTKILGVAIKTPEGRPAEYVESGQSLVIETTFETDGQDGMSLELLLCDAAGGKIALGSTSLFAGRSLPARAGVYCCRCRFDPLWLAAGNYSFDAATTIPNVSWDHYAERAAVFSVTNCNPAGLPYDLKQSSGFGNLALNFAGAPDFGPVPTAG